MVQFANRMDMLKGSEIRELLKLTAQPDIISFAGGMPAPELFPVEQMMEASIAVLKENGRAALQYSTTEGFPRLREQIAERMLAKNNIHTDADHILVTSGSQQGLDFSARVFLNPGDVVLLESPSYLGAVNAFKACEPTFIEVPKYRRKNLSKQDGDETDRDRARRRSVCRRLRRGRCGQYCFERP